jgi:hypothetical protein
MVVVVVVVVVPVEGGPHVGGAPHIPHITGHICRNLGPTNGLSHLSQQSQVPIRVGQMGASSHSMRVVVVVVVVVLTHIAHITGHASRTLSRSPFVSQSQSPTNVGHIGSSTHFVVVVVLTYVVVAPVVVGTHSGTTGDAKAGRRKGSSVQHGGGGVGVVSHGA